MTVLRILNLGAGVQSTALYLMSLRQDEPEHIPVFDYAIFADTQEEPDEVYRHLARLKTLGGPPILEATAGKLGDDLTRGVHSTGQRFASIPAYTLADGSTREGQTKRQCTAEYKVAVVESVIRRQILGIAARCRIPKQIVVHQYLGLSYDEPGRVARVKQRFAGNVNPTPFFPIDEFTDRPPLAERKAIRWAVPHFPLFDLEWARSDCVAYLSDLGMTAPRSACVFCPDRGNAEWVHLRETDPAAWNRAVDIDNALRVPGNIVNRNLDAKLYLHRSCRPLRDAPIDEPETRAETYLSGTAQECEGMCGV